jgi:hypothetical protein
MWHAICGRLSYTYILSYIIDESSTKFLPLQASKRGSGASPALLGDGFGRRATPFVDLGQPGELVSAG